MLKENSPVPAFAGLNLAHFWLCGLQSPVNMGQILRCAEMFNLGVLVDDTAQILRDPAKRQTISDFACGAMQRRAITECSSPAALPANCRLVAACIDDDAVRLPSFTFQPGDVIAIGNEYDGLPQAVIQAAKAKVYIPLPAQNLPKPKSFQPIDPARAAEVVRNGVPSLGASGAASILGYAVFSQLSHRTG